MDQISFERGLSRCADMCCEYAPFAEKGLIDPFRNRESAAPGTKVTSCSTEASRASSALATALSLGARIPSHPEICEKRAGTRADNGVGPNQWFV